MSRNSAVRVLLFALMSACTAKLITFSNSAPRRAANGSIMNAHDGTTRRFTPGGRFFYHAMSYPTCNETGKIDGCTSCIYGRDNGIAVWSSPDLSSGSWVLESTVYPGAGAGFPRCTYFRSQAIAHASSGLFILWANIAGCDAGVSPDGMYAVATAPSPKGPFSFKGYAGNRSFNGGDFALFVDEDAAAYAIVTHGTHGAGPRDMYIFKLAGDYLSFDEATLPVKLPGPRLVEAPAMFRRGSTVYALLGGCTCMGLYGGGVAVLTAPSPMGPWLNVTDALDPGCEMERQSSCFEMGPGAICDPVTQAQQNFVIEVPLVGGATAFVWTGDRWQTSPDGEYDQQPQTWLPLTFAGGTAQPLAYVDNFTLDVDVAADD
jgi:hypothetical protein